MEKILQNPTRYYIYNYNGYYDKTIDLIFFKMIKRLIYCAVHLILIILILIINTAI